MRITQQQLTDVLKQHFGYQDFREGQLEVVKAVLDGGDTLAVLPTGAGKTLLYQLPGYILEGTVVVVSPLLSLMQDQVSRLHERGEKRVTMLSSLQSVSQRLTTLRQLGGYRFVFASPEVLAQENVIHALQQIKISLFVVDEAHCVSQWGPDFRPHYLMLRQLLQTLHHPTVLMLTATATPPVQEDIMTKLGLDSQQVTRIVKSVNRSNIYLSVSRCQEQQDKTDTLISLVSQLRGAGIVYFSSRKQATEYAQLLNEQTGLRVAAYHAGIDQVTRYQIQHQFMQHRLDLICATSAFGMGIDKDDIRYVIHFHLAGNLESYVQEIGRAGRDGQQSIAILLYAPGDEQIPRQLSLSNLPDDQLIQRFVRHQVDAASLGDMGDVLTYYVQQGRQPDEISTLFSSRAQQAQRALKMMLTYIETSKCRRNIILRYFGEPTKTHDDQCCGDLVTSELLEKLGLKRQQASEVVTEKAQSWQSKLEHLFFVKS